MNENSSKIDIRTLNLATLSKNVKDSGFPEYRAKQIFEWLWTLGATEFSEMTNLPLSMREWLISLYSIPKATTEFLQLSKDGTIKIRVLLFDGLHVESVVIPVIKHKRFTVCISTQVGCSLTCSFCATGRMGRVRNLHHSEIIDQVRLAAALCHEQFGMPITNIVYMGMGEPLLNYSEVALSIERITDQKYGLGMSPSRITISTAGISKMIKKMADDNMKCRLALSLHAADDTKRNQIMPINEHNTLESLMEALKYFFTKTKGEITFEYIAFDKFNDTIQDANNLAQLCKSFPVKVNVIEYNPIGIAQFTKSSEERLNVFVQQLVNQRVNVTVRRSRGRDIDAGCGQLANKGTPS